jgi:hypothetical protein
MNVHCIVLKAEYILLVDRNQHSSFISFCKWKLYSAHENKTASAGVVKLLATHEN